MDCPQCGRELLEASRFCSWCGKDLAAPAAEFQTAATAEPTFPAPPVVERPRPHPWIRYFARSFDFALAVVVFLAGVRLTNVEIGKPEAYFIGIVVYGVYFAVESVLLWKLGTTAGKSLFHVSVGSAYGGPLSFHQSWRRSLGVFVRGVAFGIPLIMPVAQLFSYIQLIRNGQTSWDRDFGCEVRHGDISVARSITIVLAFLVVAIAFTVLFFGEAGIPASGDV
jgi:hypothetical protein